MKVSEIMTKDVVTLHPEDSVIEASGLFTKHSFEGFPVVDDKGILVGSMMRSNLVTDRMSVHIPTLLHIFEKFDLYKKDKKFVKKNLERFEKLKVKELMNTEPPLIYENEEEDTAIMLLSKMSGISPVSVVSTNRELKGVIARSDIYREHNNLVEEVEKKKKEVKAKSEIESFLDDFEENFLFISKNRTRAWMIINISFLIGGVTLALALFF